MGELKEELGKRRATFNARSGKINALLDSNFKEEAVILTVTLFEVLLKDLFILCKDVWIYHEPSGMICASDNKARVEYREKIRNYLESIKAYDDFLKNYYVYQSKIPDPEIECLYKTLFGKFDRINFQNLNGTNGARKAYNAFFDIDLMDCLDSDNSLSRKKWEKLLKLIDERHKIIHHGVNTTMTTDEIKDILSALDFLKDSLLMKLLTYYRAAISDLNQQ
jgi:hypothetical protein